MLNYKQNITSLPTYNDGKFRLFEIKQTKDTYSVEYLYDTGCDIWFEELSISDKLRFDTEERKKKITHKLRIPQTKEINSLCVVKIGLIFFRNQINKLKNITKYLMLIILQIKTDLSKQI